MDVLRKPLLILLLCLMPATVWGASWTLEDGSAIRFEAYLQGAPVQGGFERFSADIVLDTQHLAGSRIEVEIDTASIATGHKDRDTTLRSPHLFDVERWPTAHFASTDLKHLGGAAYQARGALTMRDVRRDVVLPFTLHIANHPAEPGLLRAEASGELTISRLDYGIGQGEWASTIAVGEEVVVMVQIVASAKRGPP